MPQLAILLQTRHFQIWFAETNCNSRVPNAVECLNQALGLLAENDVLGLSLDISDHIAALEIEANDYELASQSLIEIQASALTSNRPLVAAYAAERRGYALARLGRLVEAGDARREAIELFNYNAADRPQRNSRGWPFVT